MWQCGPHTPLIVTLFFFPSSLSSLFLFSFFLCLFSQPPTNTNKTRFQQNAVEIRWKGPKLALSSLRRNAVVRNFTGEAHPKGDENNVVLWDEEFCSFVNLSANKENGFHPWEIAFTIFNVSFLYPFCSISLYYVLIP
jgi:hypothetical protein